MVYELYVFKKYLGTEYDARTPGFGLFADIML